MGAFSFGLLVGWGTGLLLAAGVCAYFYRRFVLLARRTRRAERLAELGTLTSGLAHEPAYQRLVNRIATVRNETGRLREILDDFLRYAGRIEIDRKPVELNGLL